MEAYCATLSVPLPEAVASKQEASAIIDAIRERRYDPADYEYPWGVPFR